MQMSRKYFWALITGLLFAILLSCEHQATIEDVQKTVMRHHDKQVNQFILDKLSDNRIVMLGDSEHGQYLYKKTFIDFLNYWIDLHINNSHIDMPHKICLVLEMDSAYNADLHRFLKSGNYTDILILRLFTGNTGTIRNILVYYNLRDILNKIQDYNSKTNGSKLSLDIFGPEMNWDTKIRSVNEGHEYFIYQRDINIKNNIENYIQSHPDYKILAYYGSAHLISEKTMKRTPIDSSETYFVGHYLKEKSNAFGGFYRICQANPKVAIGDVHLAFCGPYSTYVFLNKYLDKNLDFGDFGRKLGDATIMHMKPRYSMKRLGDIFSETHTKFFIENMDSVKALSLDYRVRYLNNMLTYFYLLSGERNSLWADLREPGVMESEFSKWKKWYANADHDIVAQIDDMSLWKRLIENYINTSGDYNKRAECSLTKALDDSPFQYSELSIEEKGKAYYQYLEDNRTKLLCENLIPLLMIGTEDEKVKALEVLQRETGQEFTDFRDWFAWMYETQN